MNRRSFLIVAIDLGRHGGIGEADEQIGIAIGIEVAPRGGAGLLVVGQADLGGDIAEHPVVVAIETVGAAAKGDEVVEIAVAVGIGPGAGLPAGRGKQFGLDQFERGCHGAAGCRGLAQREER